MATERTDVRGLAREIGKRAPFASLHQEAFLNLMRTAGVLGGDFDRLFKSHGLSGAAYNVLRILRGAEPGSGGGGGGDAGGAGRSCGEIGEQLVAAVPDVTRLIDRLEKGGLAKRSRRGDDRRVVTVRITGAGLALLKKLDGPVLELHDRQLGHLSRSELEHLIGLLEKARGGGVEAGVRCEGGRAKE